MTVHLLASRRHYPDRQPERHQRHGLRCHHRDGSGVDGPYHFIGSVPRHYTVKFDLPTGYDAVRPAGCRNGVLPTPTTATPTRTTDCTRTYTLIAGQYRRHGRRRSAQYASLGDFVWSDNNGNGVQDSGEPGVEGVTVDLYDSTDTVIATPPPAANGDYLFDNLLPDDYGVQFVLPSTDYNVQP